MLIIICFMVFFLGFYAGSYIRGIAIGRQDWCLFRWDKTVFGYRPITFGTMLHRNDKLVMGLHFNTDGLPEEGLKYTEDIYQ
ncbi:hypothetical protein CMI47_19635 [Candidatus Pacearchaeota archaeon]|nr:hypothetical protein [Candidatus Pacearchaeota archaeon]